jgi:glucose/arabinose dehydrogenase
LATGIRDMSSLDWSPLDGNLYGIVHGWDNLHQTWPEIVRAEDDDQVADEMHRIAKGTDFGWPYTYYDGVRNMRLVSPEYGGDGNASAAPGVYSTPVPTFSPGGRLPWIWCSIPPTSFQRPIAGCLRDSARHSKQERL